MRAAIICAMMASLCSQGLSNDVKPLSRAEPIVRMVLQEGANEPFAGKVAVAGVAYDRMVDKRWPATAHEVVHQPAQFNGMDIPMRRYSDAQVFQARVAVEVAASGTRPCGTVLWYHALEVSPSWRKRLVLKCQIGNHIFYGDK